MLNTSASDSDGVKEFLPKSASTVDLNNPEEMSCSELLELFERRGFISLVKHDYSKYRLVEKYYDCLMPLCMRSEVTQTSPLHPVHRRPSIPTASPAVTCSRLDLAVTSPAPVKRKTEVALEDLIITNDPKRLTPGLYNPSDTKSANSTDHEERVLTVRRPQGLNRSVAVQPNAPPTSVITENGGGIGKASARPDCCEHTRKRVKLRRNFVDLP